MPAFRTNGGTGQAPTTVWFGRVPDKLNMLLPFHPDQASPIGHYIDKQFAANFLNQWTIWNESFYGGSNIAVGTLGGFTTAPDGTTNTAQAFVEAATNTQHFTCAGCFTPSEVGRMSFVGLFKNFGRRIILSMETVPQSGGGSGFPTARSGCKAIFDLAGGQIGVANTLFGGSAPTNWTVFPAQMIPYGGGWYLCSVETFIDNFAPVFVAGNPVIDCFVTLDNGTGTNAESSTYLGDGVSGVFGWRTNLMPSRAYALNSRPLFTDFNDFSQIDMSNTQAPGFPWYLGGPSTVVPGLPNVTDTSIFSISGSILTIAAWNSFQTNALQTVRATAASSYPGSPLIAPAATVGQGYKIPFLYEINCKWNYNIDNELGTTNSPWCVGSEYNFGQPYNGIGNGPLQIGLMGREVDFFESFRGPGSTSLLYGEHLDGSQDITNHGTTLAYVGIPYWKSVKQYHGGDKVFNTGNSNFYTCTGTVLSSTPPPSDPGHWTAYVGPPAPSAIDLTQLHTYSTLLLPAVSGDFGMAIQFFDGIYSNYFSVYGPACLNDSSLQVSDYAQLNLYLQAGAASDPGLFLAIDWVSVIQ